MSDTNGAVLPQKMVRDLKYQGYTYIYVAKSKGADQLHSYPTAIFCAFVHAYAKSRFIYEAAQFQETNNA